MSETGLSTLAKLLKTEVSLAGPGGISERFAMLAEKAETRPGEFDEQTLGFASDMERGKRGELTDDRWETAAAEMLAMSRRASARKMGQ